MKKSLISLAALHAVAAMSASASSDEIPVTLDGITKLKSENDDALVVKPGNDEYLKPIVTREMLAGDRRPIHIGQAEEQTTEIQSFYIGQFGAKHHASGAHAAAIA